MIGVNNDGSNVSIGGESCNSAAVLVVDQPRSSPPPQYTVVANGICINVVEPETHCGIYKKAYATWGVGIAVSAVISMVTGVPIGIELEAPEIGAGIVAGMQTCGTIISSFAAAKAVHKIHKARGVDTAFTDGIVNFEEQTRRSIRAAI